jgi:hypothetical protein
MIRACFLMLALTAAPAARAQAAPPAPAAADSTCTDVTVGTAQGYDCINAQLATMAHGGERPSSDKDAPVTAGSPSNVVGTFNESGTRNRLGANFGKSAQPPSTAQTYVQPLTGRPR